MKTLWFNLWWFFKSPWTKKYGIFQTFLLWFQAFFSPKITKSELTICVVAFQRKQQLEQVFLPSLLRLNHLNKMHLVLVCAVQEEANINEVLHYSGLVNFKTIGVNGFTRASCLNLAIENTVQDSIFITDVDVALPAHLWQTFHQHVKLKRAWFPICSVINKQGKVAAELPEGTGLVGFIKREGLRFNEKITSWGNEDWEFLYLLYQVGIYPKRTQKDGFVHYWHEKESQIGYQKNW